MSFDGDRQSAVSAYQLVAERITKPFSFRAVSRHKFTPLKAKFIPTDKVCKLRQSATFHAN
jgi:hypothetical protein